MNAERPLVLIVDDSRVVRQRVSSILSREGFDVILKENGEKGVLAALEYNPDAIVMDINMPVMDGFEACKLLKSHNQTRMIPLCVFTDEGSIERKVDFFNIGVEDFIRKDFEDDEIVARIKGLLRLRSLRDKIMGGAELLEKIIDSLTDSVLIFDNRDRLVLFNRMAAADFDLIPELIEEALASDIFSNYDGMHKVLKAVSSKEEIEDYTVEIALKGKLRYFVVDIKVIELAYCDGQGTAVILKDITAQKETEKLKADFYSMIAHELRTPVSVVLGYTELILEGKAGEVPELQREFIESISEKGKSLMNLVNDFLEISRFERKTVRIERVSFNIVEFLKETIDGIRLLAENRNIDLDFKSESPFIEVNADRDKLSHVFINLIENSIKYTEEGGSIEVSCEEQEKSVVVRVSDTGIGMSEEEKKYIFDMYKRLEKAEEKKIKGTGLGLAIVKEIVDAHQGSIEVESREGEGSTFIVTFPKEPVGGGADGIEPVLSTLHS
ncbi:MAG: hypothetical protein B6D63_06605 [Candidatus Latescibacteria bacterium 4484_7]|nr:MAG: hypothetical protein B6D63_06605 [Candidatus Latescibacteria bacterium 4484_7]RKZ07827.1 MAG: hypothetical protein DRQ05_02515 [bacterium]